MIILSLVWNNSSTNIFHRQNLRSTQPTIGDSEGPAHAHQSARPTAAHEPHGAGQCDVPTLTGWWQPNDQHTRRHQHCGHQFNVAPTRATTAAAATATPTNGRQARRSDGDPKANDATTTSTFKHPNDEEPTTATTVCGAAVASAARRVPIDDHPKCGWKVAAARWRPNWLHHQSRDPGQAVANHPPDADHAATATTAATAHAGHQDPPDQTVRGSDAAAHQQQGPEAAPTTAATTTEAANPTAANSFDRRPTTPGATADATRPSGRAHQPAGPHNHENDCATAEAERADQNGQRASAATTGAAGPAGSDAATAAAGHSTAASGSHQVGDWAASDADDGRRGQSAAEAAAFGQPTACCGG
jgi:hypothetical protein